MIFNLDRALVGVPDLRAAVNQMLRRRSRRPFALPQVKPMVGDGVPAARPRFRIPNGDGVGDIAGILSRLGHLSWLGAGAVWLLPRYRSPMTQSQIIRRNDDRELQTEQTIVGLPPRKLQPDWMDPRSRFRMMSVMNAAFADRDGDAGTAAALTNK